MPVGTSKNYDFYPRPPRGGRRIRVRCQRPDEKHFYPRPPRGGRRTPNVIRVIRSPFLPTPSARRATPSAQIYDDEIAISTHALREEGDPADRYRTRGDGDFYPRPPRGGRRDAEPYPVTTAQFLPTPSARRATRSKLIDRIPTVAFLPTPSARRATFGSHKETYRSPQISTHALREEGDW